LRPGSLWSQVWQALCLRGTIHQWDIYNPPVRWCLLGVPVRCPGRRILFKPAFWSHQSESFSVSSQEFVDLCRSIRGFQRQLFVGWLCRKNIPTRV
jgi:hypothetical protein